jgi:cytochrome b
MDGGAATDNPARSDAQRRNALSPYAPVCGKTTPFVFVWDLGVRVFHWALVGAVAGALATGFLAPRWWQDSHVILGTLVAALILFRIVWGLLGSTYARFASFVVSPTTTLRHARELLRGSAPHHTGHNPLGTMMIIALTALVASGVIVLGGAFKEGPLASFTSYASGAAVKEVHEALAWLLLALTLGHVAGVTAESLRTRENLIRSMISGRKPLRAGAISSRAVAARPRRASLSLAALSAALVPVIIVASQMPVRGVPTAPLDATYAKECAACHSPHHPSLAPAATWRKIIDGLSDHFGDNASLDPKQTDRLGSYLTANSAEHWDTKAANRMRVPDARGSLRITETGGWKSIHRRVAPAAFASKAVNGKLNCTACHSDAASGRFAPRSISLPRERTD